MQQTWRIAVAFVTLPLGLVACTHAMHVKNLDEYRKSVAVAGPVRVALEDGSTSPDEHTYFTFVHEALATHAGVEVALAAELPADFRPDVTVRVRPHPAYHGSGWNYVIAFPGFVLFTHAWNGFVYSADLTTDVELRDGSAAPATSSLPAHYRVRYCDADRGIATSSGWYTPGWGGLNAVIGVFMVPWDPDGTPAFQREVRSAYGDYVANSILELANGHAAARIGALEGDVVLPARRG